MIKKKGGEGLDLTLTEYLRLQLSRKKISSVKWKSQNCKQGEKWSQQLERLEILK